MVEKCIANSKYVYTHDTGTWPSRTVDIHHVVARRNGLWSRSALFAAFILLSNAFYLLVGQELPGFVFLFYLVIGALFIKSLLQKPVERESVVIIPAFGVQLESHHRSGRVVRRFVPVDKILKPVLNECVTPVTCYWSLALILRKEDELMLVFEDLRPALKMLVPIWKALCALTDSEKA